MQAAEENKKLEKRKTAIDAELAEIQPLVEEAKTAVGNIKTETLGEIRSLRAPPDVIRDILEGVLSVMGIYDTSWVSMKRSVLSETWKNLPLHGSSVGYLPSTVEALPCTIDCHTIARLSLDGTSSQSPPFSITMSC